MPEQYLIGISLPIFDYPSELEEESETYLRNMEKVLEHLKCLLINGKPYDSVSNTIRNCF